MMEFLRRLNPIGNAVILIICLFPLVVQIKATILAPKGKRTISKSNIITSFVMVIVGFVIIYFRS